MLIRFDAAPDRRRLTEAVQRASRPGVLVFRTAGAVFGLLAVVELAVLRDIFLTVLLSLACLLVVGVLPTWMVRRAVRTNWRLLGVPSSWEVNDDGVRFTSEMGDSLVRWAAVTDVQQLPDQLLLRLTRAQFISMPTTYLSAEQRAELLGFLGERGLIPGRSKSTSETTRQLVDGTPSEAGPPPAVRRSAPDAPRP